MNLLVSKVHELCYFDKMDEVIGLIEIMTFINIHITPYILILAIILLFIYFIRLDSPSKIEKGHQKRFERKCGALINSINSTSPLIRLTMYDEFLVIRGIQTYVLKYKNIRGYTLSKQLGSYGVRLIHSEEQAPPNLILWLKNEDEVSEVNKFIHRTIE